MKVQAFNARCPLEIGDKVFIRQGKDGKTAYYLPPEFETMEAELKRIFLYETRHIITDIATVHFLKNGSIQFQYEIDGSGKYEPLNIVMPIRR